MRRLVIVNFVAKQPAKDWTTAEYPPRVKLERGDQYPVYIKSYLAIPRGGEWQRATNRRIGRKKRVTLQNVCERATYTGPPFQIWLNFSRQGLWTERGRKQRGFAYYARRLFLPISAVKKWYSSQYRQENRVICRVWMTLNLAIPDVPVNHVEALSQFPLDINPLNSDWIFWILFSLFISVLHLSNFITAVDYYLEVESQFLHCGSPKEEKKKRSRGWRRHYYHKALWQKSTVLVLVELIWSRKKMESGKKKRETN